jgi:hypothetical protein
MTIFDLAPMIQAVSARTAESLHRKPKLETIVARVLQYSVGHFIDCHPIALRL